MEPSNVSVTCIGSTFGADVDSMATTLTADGEMQTSTNAQSELLYPELQEAADICIR